ncbi:alpha-amylase A type-3 [Blastomyces dermatitidis ER-3]|uniref:alpha-amylase n=4 Tax=Blastomyces TaxID=229219 RepID=A0A179V2Z2_BLAGS|nr:alpha-amylase A type-3 [Blastomyces gilchristii SLH14081]XP_045282742.1 alpha-amylase A type-3 [Blastomyces dermatitidis ER-3]EGE86564.1 alpha-amylase A type-3 [Blastomyces dermatitidis ATCC 18188]EQL30513.1 alpha-amylase A type-3 [Blastomyces dermatitidis ATCC 26199]OAT03015.1 alpha-amylase A type-3 [Blastomyces dermatitidis ER-3]OAT13691.1 alpha-amylase A type-3 [Blastomyces gilchristii SLH14081]
MKFSTSGLGAILALSEAVTAATPAEWRSQSIYFLLTDRFARTDSSTTAPCNTEDRRYCGGTWHGIINKLDYIQNMGFSAIWITPVTKQFPEKSGYGEAFHGYWQQDIYNVEPHYGSADDLRALSAALHDRGMYLMVDVVPNHMGYAGPSSSMDYSRFVPFNSKGYFHAYCPITNYDDQANVENCWLGDNTVSLPDLDTGNPEVQNIFNNWISALVSNYSIDGLRIDTVKHVPKPFWRKFNDAAGVYSMGEVYSGDSGYTCHYQNYLDGLVNFPIYYALLEVFKSPGGNIANLYNMINTMKDSCADSTLLGTFAENHDTPRFASYTKDMSLAKNALVFTILADGIPIVYAGQEQHYAGRKDPDNREATWLSGYNTESPLYQLTAKANKIRKKAIADDPNYLTYKNYPIYQDKSTIAMRKGFDGKQIITVLSNLGSGGASYTLQLGGTGYPAGMRVTDIYTCTTAVVGSNGQVPVSMAAGEPRILYPSERLVESGICG